MLRSLRLSKSIRPVGFSLSLRRGFHYNNVRFQQAQDHTTHRFEYISDFPTLSKKIDDVLTVKESGKISEQDVVDSIKACRDLQVSVHEYDKFWKNPMNTQLMNKIEEILKNENVDFNKDLLKKLLLLKLPTLTNIKIISVFYDRNPTAFIDKSIALIPFRQSLINGDLKSALTITDMTTGHPNYISVKNKELKNGVMKLAGTAIGLTLFSKIGINELIEFGYVSDGWKHLASINSMILTYIINSSFLVTVVRFGRQLITAGGNYLTWQKGTFYSHWYKHADEMLFCTKIVEADIMLNGGGTSGGESSPELIEELCRKDEFADGHTLQPGFTRDGKKIRLLEPKDNLENLKMQAYWMSGGDGFEWVEPDQDPAELIWKNYLSQFNKPQLDDDKKVKSLKWAEDLIEQK